MDDRAYAAAYVRSRLAGRPQGSRLLAAKLQSRGIGRELAGETARDAVAERDEDALAAEAAKRFLRAHPKIAAELARPRGRFTPELAKARQRLWAHLARQGFGSAAASKAVRSLNPSDGED